MRDQRADEGPLKSIGNLPEPVQDAGDQAAAVRGGGIDTSPTLGGPDTSPISGLQKTGDVTVKRGY
jgi:hypothetical protein